MILGTWNMQGSSASTENKWNSGVLAMFTQLHLEVCCLQECGGVPDSAQLVQNYHGIELYTWGTERSRKYILFYPWDQGGNRCNLAIVSRSQILQPALLYPTAGPVWRPALGANLNGLWLFSIHAISPNGPDAPGLLNAIALYAGTAGWVAAGDYNREPHTLAVPWTVNPPNGVTRPASGVAIDYAVGTNPRPVTGQVVSGLLLSDHYPVLYSL
ncbi:MAG: endonuclease/exonuclease/phosphatase family protein [Bacillota bacterium]